jgi:hypothetical protein
MANCKSGGASHRKKGGHVTPKRELRNGRLAALMFTQVNVHWVSRLDRLLKMTVVAIDKVYFLTKCLRRRSGKRVEAQALSVKQRFAA